MLRGKMMARQKNYGLTELLLMNALDFLNAGLERLFSDEATRRDVKVAVVSIQTAIELLLKYRLANEGGLAAIVRGPPPKGDVITAAGSGGLRTIGYRQSLKKVSESEYINETEHELFGHAQNLRNALVHFTADVDVDEIRQNMAWVLVGALAMFAAGQERDQGEMQTHARFLDSGNFERLTSFEQYRAQSVDSALDSPDSEHVYRCWECGVDALSLRPTETLFCHCCGLTAVLDMAGFTACTLCGKADAVLFDPLNETHGVHPGRCLDCGASVGVIVCQSCGEIRSQAGGLPARTCVVCGDPPIQGTPDSER